MTNQYTKQPAGLISVLLDKTARIDERDDAAMDLYEFDEPEARNDNRKMTICDNAILTTLVDKIFA